MSPHSSVRTIAKVTLGRTKVLIMCTIVTRLTNVYVHKCHFTGTSVTCAQVSLSDEQMSLAYANSSPGTTSVTFRCTNDIYAQVPHYDARVSPSEVSPPELSLHDRAVLLYFAVVVLVYAGHFHLFPVRTDVGHELLDVQVPPDVEQDVRLVDVHFAHRHLRWKVLVSANLRLFFSLLFLLPTAANGCTCFTKFKKKVNPNTRRQ